jgi:hypothetical protein
MPLLLASAIHEERSGYSHCFSNPCSHSRNSNNVTSIYEESCEWSIRRGWSNPNSGLNKPIDGVLESGPWRRVGWTDIATQKAFNILRGDDESSRSGDPAHSHT